MFESFPINWLIKITKKIKWMNRWI
jgi:hypothetical protein